MLMEMNDLLFSTDPVLRDEVAYSAAERWILRDKRVDAGELRQLLERWSRNLENGLGEAGTDRVFGRSFSALCLSLIAAADLQSPFLAPAEVRSFFVPDARLLRARTRPARFRRDSRLDAQRRAHL